MAIILQGWRLRVLGWGVQGRRVAGKIELHIMF